MEVFFTVLGAVFIISLEPSPELCNIEINTFAIIIIFVFNRFKQLFFVSHAPSLTCYL